MLPRTEHKEPKEGLGANSPMSQHLPSEMGGLRVLPVSSLILNTDSAGLQNTVYNCRAPSLLLWTPPKQEVRFPSRSRGQFLLPLLYL